MGDSADGTGTADSDFVVDVAAVAGVIVGVGAVPDAGTVGAGAFADDNIGFAPFFSLIDLDAAGAVGFFACSAARAFNTSRIFDFAGGSSAALTALPQEATQTAAARNRTSFIEGGEA